jgi:outer membrane protein TolC
MRRLCVLALCFCFAVSAHAEDGARPLRLDEVLDSLDRSFPLLLAEQEKVAKAEAEQQSAASAFDTKVKLKSSNTPLGKDEYGRVETLLTQDTPYRGLSLYAGWSLGAGQIPDYYGEYETNSGGDVLAGLSVPLLRGGATDEARAGLSMSELAVREAEAERSRKRLAYRRTAALKYWDWVAAGLRLNVERSLLDIATDRDAGLRERFAQGALPEIEVTDNQRIIVARRLKVIDAERKLAQSALELSLYLRNSRGERMVVGAERLPQELPEPTEPKAHSAREDRAPNRPERQKIAAAQEQARVSRSFAENLRLPALSFSFGASQGLAARADEKAETELSFALTGELPAQNRKARGAAGKARAEIARLDEEQRYLDDSIAVECQSARLALEAAYLRSTLANEGTVLAMKLEDAERERFSLGASTLLVVNLREQARAEAAIAEIDAHLAYWQAQVELSAALGDL